MERHDAALAQRRKFEALLGQEPDEANEQTLQSLLEDSKVLGVSAMNEVAAGHGPAHEVLSAERLDEMARENGFDASPRDSFQLLPRTGLPMARDVTAWKLGALAAKAVRDQALLGADTISDRRLSEMAGVDKAALAAREAGPDIAYALDRSANASRVVFRSKWRAGRRFELARLLGDRLVGGSGGRLFPATRAHTYRQKMQRSFAAELLSPFEAVSAALDGDYSDEAQQEMAEHFQVSPLTIRTLLVNHGRLDREELESDVNAAAA